jgi:hypothetical protein
MGEHQVDIGEGVLVKEAGFPASKHGLSLPWKAGVLWDRCPTWHLRYSPYAKAAGRLVSKITRARDGSALPPNWTRAGAQLAETELAMRRALDNDRIERAKPPPPKPRVPR